MFHSENRTAPLPNTAKGDAAMLLLFFFPLLIGQLPSLAHTHVYEHAPPSRIINWIWLNSMQIIFCANGQQMVAFFVTFFFPSCEKKGLKMQRCVSWACLGYAEASRTHVSGSVNYNKTVYNYHKLGEKIANLLCLPKVQHGKQGLTFFAYNQSRANYTTPISVTQHPTIVPPLMWN